MLQAEIGAILLAGGQVPRQWKENVQYPATHQILWHTRHDAHDSRGGAWICKRENIRTTVLLLGHLNAYCNGLVMGWMTQCGRSRSVGGR